MEAVVCKINRKRTNSQMKMIWLRFKKNKLAMLGLIVIMLMLILFAAAPIYLNYNTAIKQSIVEAFQPPSEAHIFGTDQFGRDLFARIIYGGRISLVAGLVTVGISFFVGLLLGGMAGYFGGKTDMAIMSFCDMLMAVPNLLMAMCIVAALGQGLMNMLIALSVAQIPRETRTVRAAVLNLRNQEFIEAAKCCGTGNARILYRHIVPNIFGPMMISVTMGLGSTILSIASLGYLGIGISPPTPEWGTIISENQSNLLYYPHLGIIPGIFILVSVLCLSFIGDGMRDALDPKMKN